ncbi:MAG: ParB/RepB/Spo0J family partition protein [Desulfatiglans sp.]|jgi:ParB family chromosome partitioning protein|nr:ParB/RepB/Spo0J family partition protein [Thermodesulfobacteriota bacterium]MEE4351477.1 ParB/RepB/Spo0J family partition protein [Desulfatiglans sp.]
MVQRKALGKGLSALIPDAHNLDEGVPRFFDCPVGDISPNPHQPRRTFSTSELEEMAVSVKEKGILTPVLVSKTESGYQLIAGERRWRAAQIAGLETVPVIVREAGPTESLELALIENLHRKDLNPIEEALAYQRLLDETGMTQESLGKRLGKERSSITNMMRLLTLPSSIQQDLVDGRLTMGHARVLAGVKGSKEQISLRDMVLEKGLSVRQLEALAKKMNRPVPKKKKAPDDDYYLQTVADDLKRSLGTKVDIKRRGKQGTIIVHFYSDKELDRIVEMLG